MVRGRSGINHRSININIFAGRHSRNHHYITQTIYKNATTAAKIAATEPAAGMVMAEPALTAAEEDAELEEEVVVLVS